MRTIPTIKNPLPTPEKMFDFKYHSPYTQEIIKCLDSTSTIEMVAVTMPDNIKKMFDFRDHLKSRFKCSIGKTYPIPSKVRKSCKNYS